MAFFQDTPAQFKQVSQYSPQIQGALENKVLQGLGKNFDFAPIAQQAREQFKTQIVPTIAERFTSMGGGAQRSSAFPAALGQAGAGLEGQLAALQAQYGLQQQDLLARLLGQSAQQTAYQPQQPSDIMMLLAQLLGGVGGAFGQIGGQFLGNKLLGFPQQQQQTQQGRSSTGGGGFNNLLRTGNNPYAPFPGSYSTFPRQF